MKPTPICAIFVFPIKTKADWTVRWESFKPFEILIYDDYRVDETGAECPQLGYFDTEYRYPRIYENGWNG